MSNHTHYVLIDYENIQPKDIHLLKDGPFKVKIFLGPHQTKARAKLTTALQMMDDHVEYIPLKAHGKNALDFHIAYTIGVLSTKEPKSRFSIISKDSGFDSLLQYFNDKGILARRLTGISDVLKMEKLEWAVKRLLRLKESRPRTKRTLLNMLRSWFGKELSEDDLSGLLEHLCRYNFVKVDGGKVSYALPNPA